MLWGHFFKNSFFGHFSCLFTLFICFHALYLSFVSMRFHFPPSFSHVCFIFHVVSRLKNHATGQMISKKIQKPGNSREKKHLEIIHKNSGHSPGKALQKIKKQNIRPWSRELSQKISQKSGHSPGTWSQSNTVSNFKEYSKYSKNCENTCLGFSMLRCLL